ncbi:MAG: CocE/NonD family hydrolase, partial [Lentisphaeria bacterium]|nr:CocE/NonD family hydrolase [Lentisphaeria bacterium]
YDVTDIPQMKNVCFDMKSIKIPMRDGVELHCVLYFPQDFKGTAPILLLNTPYTCMTIFNLPDENVLQSGCIYALLATRGTAWSGGGIFHPSDTEIDTQDMEDFFLWLEKQSFFNGRCAMFGASYPGYTQWCAQRTAHDCLKATAPRVAPLYSCNSPVRPNGGIYIGLTHWITTMYFRRNYGYTGTPDFNGMKFLSHLPFNEIDQFVYGKSTAIFQDYIGKVKDMPGTFANYKKHFTSFKAPAFIAGGWFDPFKQEVLESFQLMKDSAATEEARKFTRITMGPWGHGGLENPEIFGAENNHDELNKRQQRFLLGLLQDPQKDPLPEEKGCVRFFMIGENRWYDSETWPPAGQKEYKLYLHSSGNANSCCGDGKLNNELPAASEIPDHYISDPECPVSPTEGRHNPQACYDRLFMEKSNNMLIYTTEKFSSPLSMAGNFKLRFHASATTVDTDFFATLTMVTPEGKSLFLTQGMIRARHRNTLEKEEFLTPGEIYQYQIDMGDLAVTILPGYALWLELHGQEFPLYERNAISGKAPLTDTELFRSVHTIYHDKEHVAELLLPVNTSFAETK